MLRTFLSSIYSIGFSFRLPVTWKCCTYSTQNEEEGCDICGENLGAAFLSCVFVRIVPLQGGPSHVEHLEHRLFRTLNYLVNHQEQATSHLSIGLETYIVSWDATAGGIAAF